MLKIIFLFLLSGGLPVAMAMAAASLIYLLSMPETMRCTTTKGGELGTNSK